MGASFEASSCLVWCIQPHGLLCSETVLRVPCSRELFRSCACKDLFFSLCCFPSNRFLLSLVRWSSFWPPRRFSSSLFPPVSFCRRTIVPLMCLVLILTVRSGLSSRSRARRPLSVLPVDSFSVELVSLTAGVVA
jgi:hypothetical protein